MRILNYTPHTISLLDGDGHTTEYTSNGVARCKEQKTIIGSAGGYPVYSITYGELSGLPDVEDNTVIIVSALAAQAAKATGRNDCYIVADTVRNDAGQVVGAKGLAIV
jgi:hypothetical protein